MQPCGTRTKRPFQSSPWLGCRLSRAFHAATTFLSVFKIILFSPWWRVIFFSKMSAKTQIMHAWWAATGASSEGKSLTQVRGAGGGVRDTRPAARSTLVAIKEGKQPWQLGERRLRHGIS